MLDINSSILDSSPIILGLNYRRLDLSPNMLSSLTIKTL